SISCAELFRCTTLAQLTFRESLRNVEACLRSPAGKLYPMGIRGPVSHNTLAHAHMTRDGRIHANLAQRLIVMALFW
ncbi:transposase IS4 family protein, partial [mine drainage metagenome]